MTAIDLTDVEKGDRLTVELESGERFEDGYVSSAEVTHAEEPFEKTRVRLGFENDFWEQVRDRVDSEVLDIMQESERGGEPMEQPTLAGVYWEGPSEESSTPHYKELGTIVEVERHA